MQRIVFKGVPLNRENLKRIRQWMLIKKIKTSQRGSLSMSESEFESLASELGDSAVRGQSKETGFVLELRDRIKKVGLESYPGILSKDEKYDHILQTFKHMDHFGITGRCFEKLRELVKPIKWVDDLLEAYKGLKVIS